VAVEQQVDIEGGLQVTVTASPIRVTRQAGARVRSARRTTPVLLRGVAVSVAILALVAGLIAALATSERQGATTASWQNAEPLMVTAQTVDTSLSDADTTAAASFLQGRLEPAGLERRYQSDLAIASADVAVAAREAGSDPEVAASLETLSTDLPVYSGIVQDADFNERQGSYPLAAAYISEANNLMRSSILPAAATVYGTEGSRLADDQSISPLLAILAALAFLGLLVLLVVAQRWLSRRFHRTWNVALAVATVIVLALGLWFTVALTTQTNGVNSALANGSRPVSIFTQARILALRARADDELTLLTRDSDPTFQADYRSTAADLGHLLDTSGSSTGAAGSPVRTQLARAKATFGSYASLHGEIRQDDLGGNLAGAVGLAAGSSAHDLPAISSDLNSDLADGITASQSTFVNTTSDAASDLDGLIWGLAVGVILIAALVLIGFQPRIEEYR
jgi:hypothetical protein